MKNIIYNKIANYYINKFIKEEDYKLIDDLIVAKLNENKKKIVKINYVWEIILENDYLKNKYNNLFDNIPVILTKDVKYYNYSKKKLIQHLLDMNIDMDNESRELILNILYLLIEVLFENYDPNIGTKVHNETINNNIYKLINMKLSDIPHVNKYILYQDIILTVILIELINNNYKKINILQLIDFLNKLKEENKYLYIIINNLILYNKIKINRI